MSNDNSKRFRSEAAPFTPLKKGRGKVGVFRSEISLTPIRDPLPESGKQNENALVWDKVSDRWYKTYRIVRNRELQRAIDIVLRDETA